MRPCVEGKENSSSNYGNNGHIKPRCFPKRRETDLRQVVNDPRFPSVRLRSANLTRFSEKPDKRASHHGSDQGHNYEHGEDVL